MATDHAGAEPGAVAAAADLVERTPVGLVSFGADGRVVHANPAAVRLLAATVGPAFAPAGLDGGPLAGVDLVAALAPRWPELPELLAGADPMAGSLLADHRLDGPGGRCLSVTITRAAPGQLLATLVDATGQVTREREADAGRARLQALVDSATDGIITIHEDGIIEAVNPAAERLFGYRADEMIGADVSMLMAEPDRSAHPDHLRRYLVTGQSRLIGRRTELQARRRDGTIVPVELSVTEVATPGGARRFTGTVHDITIRARARADLAAREAELSTLFSSIDEGFCVAEMIVDAAGRPIDYRFLEVNPRFEAMTGLVDATGRTALDLVPDLEARWIETYARVGLRGETIRFEDGSEAMGRWFEVFATPLAPAGRFAIVFKDQTLRRRWEQQLRESEQRFRTMADELPLLVWEADASGRQIWVNQTFRTFFGQRGMDAQNHDVGWQHRTHPDDAATAWETYEAAMRERREFHAEFRARRADGGWRWLESWARPRFGEHGELLGYIGSSADITERKEAEVHLQRTAALDAFWARLGDVVRGVDAPLEIEARAAEALARFLGAWRVHYCEIEPDGEHAVVRADYHPDAPSSIGRYRLDDFGAATMAEMRSGCLVAVDDVTTDDRLTPAEREASLNLSIVSYVMAPLAGGGRPAAAMLVAHHRWPHVWTDEELAAVAETAERTWTQIERVRAETELQRRHRQAELLADVLSGLETEATLAGQLQRLVEHLVPALADFATVELPDAEHPLLALAHRDADGADTLRTLRRRHRLGTRANHSVAWAAAGQSQLIAEIDPASYQSFGPSDHALVLLHRLDPRSHMAVPIRLGGDGRAALLVGRTAGRPPFTADDLAFLGELSERASVVLNATHLRRTQLDVSLRLQRALLPDQIEWHPDLEIEAVYQAASEDLEVGGDWYDTFSWPDGWVGLIVGDVVGHNLDSVVAMGRLRAGTSALAGRLPASPAALVDALDGYAQGRDGTSFTTVVCLVVDPATGELRYSSAGHLPALVISAGGRVTRLDQAQSLPLCSIPAGPRPEARCNLEPGDLVVAYSDGLVERRTRGIDEGLGQLEACAAELAGLPLTELADRLMAAMIAVSPAEDDMVVTCLRYAPAVARFHRRLPADTAQLVGLRAELQAWLADRGVGGRTSQDLLLVVSEASTNAIEHAYHDRSPGEIEVEVTDHRYHVTARVSDQGVWRPTGSHSRGRGWGSTIMEKVAWRYSRATTPEGTTVLLTLPIPEPTSRPA